MGHGAQRASVGIAGVNTHPLHAATLGIAGNWGSTLRPHLQHITSRSPLALSSRLGDQAARVCWSHACYLLDYTYVTCPDRSTQSLRYRSGFARMCAPETRTLPVYLDSAAYREAAGTAPRWSNYDRYCAAIDLIRPDGAMAMDVLDNQDASRGGYDRLCRDGYADVVIPVWQARPAWDPTCNAADNARLATHDPTLRFYVDRASVVAVGGLVHGPCPRAMRHLYLAELVRAFPDTHFWALGQASAMVVNGLGQLGILDRVSCDGSWWIHHARTEQFAVVQDGLLKSLRLTHTGASSFFTLPELMAANLRSLLSAYAGLWVFPAPADVPTDLRDPEVRLELRRRLAAVQLDLFAHLPIVA
ncbi:MAG: hypothetical protein M3069_15745 [Chloroflexota bacterium]|nr:hypothetical protein [Chloroflexota bacterium]